MAEKGPAKVTDEEQKILCYIFQILWYNKLQIIYVNAVVIIIPATIER
jgi:LPS O-antigen subunit length determinant protein (WzzB/FepE family)